MPLITNFLCLRIDMSFTPVINGRPIFPIGAGTFGYGGGDKPLEPGSSLGAPFRDMSCATEQAELLRYVISRGVNLIDCAEMYGCGGSEEVVGQAIAGLQSTMRHRLVITSKVWRPALQQPQTIPGAVLGMLARLTVSQLDVLYVHALYEGTNMAEYLAAMNELVDEGLTKSIGLSNVTLDQLKTAQALSRHPIVAVQNLFSPLYHHDVGNKPSFSPELRAYCRGEGITMVAHTPLHLGSVASNKRLCDIGITFGLEPAQLSLAWILHHGIVPIPHFGRHDFVEEDLRAAYTRLTPGAVLSVDRLDPEPIPARGVYVAA